MKSVYLIQSKHDGGMSQEIRTRLAESGIVFTALMYGKDTLPWSEISAVPCVVVDVDGHIESVEEHRPERPYNHAEFQRKLAAAPETKPPVVEAPIESKDDLILKELREITTRLTALEAKAGPTR